MHRIAAPLPLLVATAVSAQTTTADNASPLAMTLFATAFFCTGAWYAWMAWCNEKRHLLATKKAA